MFSEGKQRRVHFGTNVVIQQKAPYNKSLPYHATDVSRSVLKEDLNWILKYSFNKWPDADQQISGKDFNKGVSMKLTNFLEQLLLINGYLWNNFCESHSHFCYATWFFPVKIHIFKLSLKPDKVSIEYPFPEVIRIYLSNDYKKRLTL